MKTVKFRTLWGVCEFLEVTGVRDVQLVKSEGVWNLTYNAEQQGN